MAHGLQVDVDWIAACKFGDDSGAPPPATSDPKDLRLFSYFAYTCWQLGDRALLHNGLALADLQALTREGGALPEELPQPAGQRPFPSLGRVTEGRKAAAAHHSTTVALRLGCRCVWQAGAAGGRGTARPAAIPQPRRSPSPPLRRQLRRPTRRPPPLPRTAPLLMAGAARAVRR